MSTANFIKFYAEHLPKHPDLKAAVDGAGTPKAFASAVMEHGKAAGFDFSEEDVDQVMIASLNKHAAAGELNEAQLDGVVGGAGQVGAVPTIQIQPVKSLVNLGAKGNAASTIMCPGFAPQGTAVLPATKAVK